MDGMIEPVILVLGNPIAGNPIPFALERAFESLSLSYRVLSCELQPTDFEAAIEGARVLGIRAVFLDASLSADSHFGQSGLAFDFLDRKPGEDTDWYPMRLINEWLYHAILGFLPTQAVDNENLDPSSEIASENIERRLLWIGEEDARFPSDLATSQSRSPIAWAPSEAIEQADMIAISNQIEVDSWPQSQKKTLVIDLATPPNELAGLKSLGYHVIDFEALRVGVLASLVERVTGQQADSDVIQEAIEEYLAV